jgi:hypothetical protein
LEAVRDQHLAVIRQWAAIGVSQLIIAPVPFVVRREGLFAVRVSKLPFPFLTAHSFPLTKPFASSNPLTEQWSGPQVIISLEILLILSFPFPFSSSRLTASIALQGPSLTFLIASAFHLADVSSPIPIHS